MKTTSQKKSAPVATRKAAKPPLSKSSAAKAGASKAGPARPAPTMTAKAAEKPAATKSAAKSAGLSKVEALLGHARAAADAPPAEGTRIERTLARVEKGEPGPIRIAELVLDPAAIKAARDLGLVEGYKRILKSNPSAQPGRPLVNVLGTTDKDLSFQLLSLHELVLAAKELGRDLVQVSLVRLSPVEAKELIARPAPVVALAPEPKKLTPFDIAAMNGFLELELSAIARSENLRQEIRATSPEFLNLVESIREIGLQNPPVVEVRARGNKEFELVCVSGHRRLLALETLGQAQVTCALKTFRSDKHRALAGLAENINREDLHFLDKADAYGALTEHGMTVGEIAALLDTDARTIGKYVRAAGWDLSVKRRVREMGAKATTRFLLNMMAAGERTAPELHGILDRFQQNGASPSSKPLTMLRGPALKRKLGEFYSLSGCNADQRGVVEKALRFLGFVV